MESDYPHGYPHKSYILRIWQVERDDQPALAAVLEDCQTSERQAFANLAALVEFLEANLVQSLCIEEESL